MQRNVAEYIENAARLYGNKTAITDGSRKISFAELQSASRTVAAALCARVKAKEPVMICMSKSIEFVEAMLACAQIGAVYVPLDITTPALRLQYIQEALSARFILCRKGESVPAFGGETEREILYIEDLLEQEIDEDALNQQRERILVTDPLYMIFTSGSTGKPKGIVTTHLALISFIDAMAEEFSFSAEDSLANQVPFYFDASTKDIYLMCKCGCTMHIIPQKLFMLPKDLMSFLNEKKITRIIWAPSLLCMAANLHAFEKVRPQYLRTVFFVGEQMPTKQMNMWRRCLPDAQYVNLYGSSEVTGSSAYYIIQREMDDTETIPIGSAFHHMELFLLDEKERLIEEENTVGEICVRGLSLTLGYLNDAEKTDRVFVQNPLNPHYRDLIYRSGDLGRYNEFHELVYICRKDYQIKRMGQRIELGEIEAAVGAVDGVERTCCLFNEKTQALLTLYTGDAAPDHIKIEIEKILPQYMLPTRYVNLEDFPLNANGKIDRVALKRQFC